MREIDVSSQVHLIIKKRFDVFVLANDDRDLVTRIVFHKDQPKISEPQCLFDINSRQSLSSSEKSF